MVRSHTPDLPVIRDASVADCDAVADIYNHYVAHTIVTFEEQPVSAPQMAARLEEVRSVSLPWLVAEVHERVVGYAYAAKWKERWGYRFAAEITVYLDGAHAGRGIGSRLYAHLLPLLQERGMRAIIGGIALPNQPSIALHEKFGMTKVAHFEEVGFKFGQWIDVGYWQRTFR